MTNPEVLVEVVDNPIDPIKVWMDNVKDRSNDIASVEGVTNVFVANETEASIRIDERYNVDEIACKLRELLTSESI